MLDDENYIRFTAALPPIATAITLDGMGDGAQIKLEVSRAEVKAVLKLQLLTGKYFEVIIIPLDEKVINKKIRFLKDIEDEQKTKTDSPQSPGRESGTSSIKHKRTKTKKG